MLDSPERVSAGQARFKYPATFVLFSNFALYGSDATWGNGRPHSGSLVVC